MNNSPFNWSGKPSSFVTDKDKNKFNGVNTGRQQEPSNTGSCAMLYSVKVEKKKEPVSVYNLPKASRVKDKTYQPELKAHNGN